MESIKNLFGCPVEGLLFGFVVEDKEVLFSDGHYFCVAEESFSKSSEGHSCPVVRVDVQPEVLAFRCFGDAVVAHGSSFLGCVPILVVILARQAG